MGWPTAEFFVDVIFSTTHALRAFWRVFPRALGRALHYMVGAQHVLSHCSAAKPRFSEKRWRKQKIPPWARGICRLCRRDPELHTLVYLLLSIVITIATAFSYKAYKAKSSDAILQGSFVLYFKRSKCTSSCKHLPLQVHCTETAQIRVAGWDRAPPVTRNCPQLTTSIRAQCK